MLSLLGIVWLQFAQPAEMKVPAVVEPYQAEVFEVDLRRPQTAPVAVEVPKCTEMGNTYWKTYISQMKASESEKAWLIKTAQCESGLNNCAFSGFYCGIMQYSESTFANAGGKNIWDGAEQLQLALNYYRHRGTDAWPHCGK